MRPAMLDRPAPAEALRDLARRVERLRPSHRDPFAFFEEKDEIAHALRQLAADVAGPCRGRRP